MFETVLDAEFYRRPAPELAIELLGCRLVHRVGSEWVGGIINETEAYTQDDEASHSFRGPTARTQPMFGPGGTIYVYLIYGIHFCLNITAGEVGQGDAVLIRSIKPIWGIEIMRRLRQWPEPKPLNRLCDGPGKLTRAMAINLSQNGLWPDQNTEIRIAAPEPGKRTYTTGPRIGISKNVECPWRFCMS